MMINWKIKRYLNMTEEVQVHKWRLFFVQITLRIQKDITCYLNTPPKQCSDWMRLCWPLDSQTVSFLWRNSCRTHSRFHSPFLLQVLQKEHEGTGWRQWLSHNASVHTAHQQCGSTSHWFLRASNPSQHALLPPGQNRTFHSSETPPCGLKEGREDSDSALELPSTHVIIYNN